MLCCSPQAYRSFPRCIKEESMKYWIFITTEHKVDGEIFRARNVYQQRMRDKFWGFEQCRKNLSEGDQVVFYVGVPEKVFAGTATLDSKSFEPSADEKNRLDHGKQHYRAAHGVWLRDIQTWDTPRRVEDVLPNLKFVQNKSSWGAYFQGSVREIIDEDFR